MRAGKNGIQTQIKEMRMGHSHIGGQKSTHNTCVKVGINDRMKNRKMTSTLHKTNWFSQVHFSCGFTDVF